jgi:hypothetical protein
MIGKDGEVETDRGTVAEHVNSLRQWQHDSRLSERVRRLAGDAADRIEALASAHETMRSALTFYGDPKRYEGPNRRIADGAEDEWSVSGIYWHDVSRDGGDIARKALGAHSAKP